MLDLFFCLFGECFGLYGCDLLTLVELELTLVLCTNLSFEP